MIKKLAALLLALCLCLSLAACGKGKTPNRKKIEAMFKDLNNITYLVQVSINPEFELHLDERGEVCDLIYLNKDAEAAFAEVVSDTVGKSYDEAMSVLLEAAKRGGYLTDESTVAVTVVVRAGGEMGDTVIADLEKAVQEYVSAEQYTLQVLDGRASEGSDPEGDDGDQGDDGVEIEEERDAKGKLIRRTERYQMLEGLRELTEYFDANEKLVKKVEERNGAVVLTCVYEYDANGNLATCATEQSTPEGILKITESFGAGEKLVKKEEERNGVVIAVYEYDADGKLVSRTEENQTPEGPLKITKYFGAGEIISKKVEEQNGTVIAVHEYDANGQRISCVRESQTAEGLLRLTEYFGPGEMISKDEQTLNGTVISASEYDANGRKISYVQNAINPEGVPETRSSTFSYDENGNIAAEYTHVSDGRYIEAHYYANGNMAHQYIQTADGGYLDDSYDEGGNLTSRKRKVIHDWGAYSLWTDYPDGTREEYFYETDGSVWYNWFDANGNQLGPKRVQ